MTIDCSGSIPRSMIQRIADEIADKIEANEEEPQHMSD